MTPAARLQAAIEVLDEVVASARADGPAADAIVGRYFKTRRYAGSKDRRAVRELVFRAIRRSGDMPESGRAAVLGLAGGNPELRELFGQPRGPEPLSAAESAPEPSLVPQWLVSELSALVTGDELPALLERAPLDLRANVVRISRDALAQQIDGAEPTPLSPWGLRLPPDRRVDDHPAYAEGLFEVQDEGSQLIALACSPADGQRILDLCAGAGGKALALAAATPTATLLATDSNRARLSKLAPRAERAGAAIDTRLLDPPAEVEQLADWRESADVVLVDAPCSGSGTWRRNPEGRWRLTPERLDRLVATQARLLDIAAGMVGAGQAAAFLDRHSSWVPQETPIPAGRLDGVGRLLTPGHDATDGFFVARLQRA